MSFILGLAIGIAVGAIAHKYIAAKAAAAEAELKAASEK